MPRSDWLLPSREGWSGRAEKVLVVQQRREAVVLTSFRQVSDLGAAAEEAVEADREGLWVETS